MSRQVRLALALALALCAPLALALPFNALGTLGVEREGSCGFTATYPPEGVFLAAFSAAIYGNGATCGACYVASCAQSPQCTGERVAFVVTNQCLGENTTSPCVTGRHGVALQNEAFDVIAKTRDPGIVPVVYTQVPCRATGGVQFVPQTADQGYFSTLIQNVGGPGSLARVEVSTNGATFTAMTRSYGAVWQATNFNMLPGAVLHFRLTGYNGQILIVRNALPVGWLIKEQYTATTNFGLQVAAKAPAK